MEEAGTSKRKTTKEMDEDKVALIERIITEVHNIITRNFEILSFEIIPAENNFENFENNSPVHHEENHLGLESWCKEHVYLYCYKELKDRYLSKPKHRQPKWTSDNSERYAMLLNLTSLLSPEIGSLWNKRRELVKLGLLQRYTELKFSRLVLTSKPKCSEAFEYRKWILEVTYKDVETYSRYMQTLINEELEVCELTAEKSHSNYHSWTHRIWLVNRLESIKYERLDQLLTKEFEFSLKWVRTHVSDYSGVHYRQFCVNNIFKISDDNFKRLKRIQRLDMRRSLVGLVSNQLHDNFKTSENDLMGFGDIRLCQFLLGITKDCKCVGNLPMVMRKLEVFFYELEVNNELIRFYKLHESLWVHRRFIIHEILQFLYQYFGLERQRNFLMKVTCLKCDTDDRKPMKLAGFETFYLYATILFAVLICQEKNFLEEREREHDIYTESHEQYLKTVEGLNTIM